MWLKPKNVPDTDTNSNLPTIQNNGIFVGLISTLDGKCCLHYKLSVDTPVVLVGILPSVIQKEELQII